MAAAKQRVDPVDPASEEAKGIRDDFGRFVNMTASELERWLESDESQSAGQKDGGGESVGHESGRRIAAILSKRQDELTGEDIAHMKKTNAYVKRHLSQRPEKPQEELERMTWTHSLRNWGHDPLK